MSRRKSLVLLSGGMDSAVLLAASKHEGHEVYALGINYGQRHWREQMMARKLGYHYDIPFEHISLPVDVLSSPTSSQTNPHVAVPTGHYAADNMKTTVVPNRNMVLISMAISRGIAKGCDEVLYAAHAGDHDVYPDCRPQFVAAMQAAVALCDWSQIELKAPFLSSSKADIVQLGMTLKVPFEITRTCYTDEVIACGKCGTCVERLEAFHLAGYEDPLQYSDREFWKTVVKGQ
jgi:7-cyano-7-deazaguanine synthase